MSSPRLEIRLVILALSIIALAGFDGLEAKPQSPQWTNSHTGFDDIFKRTNTGDVFNNRNTDDIFNNLNTDDIFKNRNTDDFFKHQNTDDFFKDRNNDDIFKNSEITYNREEFDRQHESTRKAAMSVFWLITIITIVTFILFGLGIVACICIPTCYLANHRSRRTAGRVYQLAGQPGPGETVMVTGYPTQPNTGLPPAYQPPPGQYSQYPYPSGQPSSYPASANYPYPSGPQAPHNPYYPPGSNNETKPANTNLP